MTKRIFRSIFAVALTVLLAACLLILGAVHSYFSEVQFNQLRVETALASHAVTNEGVRYFDKLDDTMDDNGQPKRKSFFEKLRNSFD